MTKSVGVHEAKTHFSRLLDRIALGEQVTITRRGEAVARLVPIGAERRAFGIDRGRFVVPDDFNAPLDEDPRAARTVRLLLDTQVFPWPVGTARTAGSLY
jgi:prevent-host-death family protein